MTSSALRHIDPEVGDGVWHEAVLCEADGVGGTHVTFGLVTLCGLTDLHELHGGGASARRAECESCLARLADLRLREDALVATARRLLPKYGGVAQFALNQACLLHAIPLSAGQSAKLERAVLAARCEGQARYGDSSQSVTRCAGWCDHEGDHVVGCSECWRRFHPQNTDGLAVNAANPLCPITNLPCVREDEAAMVGRLCVVRRGGRDPWVVATVAGVDHGVGGPWWLLNYPDGSRMLVKPNHVTFPRRRLETT